jgi:recombination protein RecT
MAVADQPKLTDQQPPAAAEQTKAVEQSANKQVIKGDNATQKRQQIEKFFAAKTGDFLAALGNGTKVERWKALLLMEIYRKPDLADCTPASIVAAALEAAGMGLEFGPKKHSYLIARNNKVKIDGREQYEKQCTCMPGYTGLTHLARLSGKVDDIEAHVVRQGDHFDFELGLNPTLSHKPNGNGTGEVTHAYAICWFSNGKHKFVVLPRVEIESIRKRSITANNGPWVSDYAEMAKKTAIRRIVKGLELGDAFAAAVARDEEFETIDVQPEPMRMPEAIEAGSDGGAE